MEVWQLYERQRSNNDMDKTLLDWDDLSDATRLIDHITITLRGCINELNIANGETHST